MSSQSMLIECPGHRGRIQINHTGSFAGNRDKG